MIGHPFVVSTRWSAAGPVVRVAGELDGATAGRFRDAVRRALDGRGRHLLIDAADLDFVDSTAIGVLVSAVKTMAARGGVVTIVRPRRSIVRVLEMTGLDQRLRIDHGTSSGGAGAGAGAASVASGRGGILVDDGRGCEGAGAELRRRASGEVRPVRGDA